MKCKFCGSQWQSKVEVKTCPFCGKSLAEPDSFEDIESALAFIMDRYREQVNRNPNHIVAYLGDLAPKLVNERRLLKMCAEAGIIAELYSVTDKAQRDPAAKRAVAVLSGTYFLDAKWAEAAVGWLTSSMGWTSHADGGAPAPQARPVQAQPVSGPVKTSAGQPAVPTPQTQEERIRKRREELKRYAGRIVCGPKHILALRSDGTVTAYGKNEYGECNVADWRDVTAMACSLFASVGLTAKRTMLCTKNSVSSRYPWQNIVQIAAWGFHPVGLCADGSVIAGWTDKRYTSFTNWRNVTAIASSAGTLYGLLADGTVAACGASSEGQCDIGDWRDVVSIAAYNYVVYGIRRDGLVYARGRNEHGECDVDSWRDIIDTAPGYQNVFGLKSDGSVVYAGEKNATLEKVHTWTDIVALANGLLNIIGLKADGTVVVCDAHASYDVSGWRDIVAIACGWSYVAGLQADGTVVFAGKGKYGEDQIAGQNLFH